MACGGLGRVCPEGEEEEEEETEAYFLFSDHP